MRDPDRIDKLLTKLRYEWMKFPDLRLGQLLVNLISIRREGIIAPEIFHFEDDELVELLDRGGLLSHYGPENQMRKEDQPAFDLMAHEEMSQARHEEVLQAIQDIRQMILRLLDERDKKIGALFKKIDDLRQEQDDIVETLRVMKIKVDHVHYRIDSDIRFAKDKEEKDDDGESLRRSHVMGKLGEIEKRVSQTSRQLADLEKDVNGKLEHVLQKLGEPIGPTFEDSADQAFSMFDPHRPDKSI